VTSKLVKFVALSTLAACAASCGEFTRQGQSPSLIVIRSLEAASGATPSQLGGTLNSDVEILITSPAPCSPQTPCATIVNDVAEVTMSVILKDPGVPGLAANPSFLNAVTINRYRVDYVRPDGRNVPGVDVPYPFDSALTFTIPNDGSATAGFQIVRHSAKVEAPLRTLAANGNMISTIAYVTFFGRDQAGNDISARGSIGIDFGNFADPD
jgi:hypothetical protein